MIRLVGAVVLIHIVLVLPLSGQKAKAEADRALGDAAQSLQETPQVTLVRTEDAPEIDGVLDDTIWQDAVLLSELIQVEPTEGAAPSERTEVRLLYSADSLYISVRCFDAEPHLIVANEMKRDAVLRDEDHIGLILDTFHDKRNAYFFEINPNGSRGDGLIENNGKMSKEWDGIWYGASQIDGQGWTAEMAIPFKTISFDPSSNSWGFNISRSIRRRRERLRWASPVQQASLFDVARAGVMAGIREIQQGIGLDVKPFLSLKLRNDDGSNTFKYDPGIDIFYKFTPQLTGVFTANTDFAETEVDERQVNLDRFPLFFPEKRDFFLQDAGIFKFGGIRRDPIAFHSRRIGIGPGGKALGILAGVRLTGRIEKFNIGFIDVQMQDEEGLGSKNLAVGRVSMNILDESTVGVITTLGNPASTDSNALVGMDFNYRTSKFMGDKALTGHLWFQQTFSPDADGSESAYGVKLRYPNDRIDAMLGASEIGEAFNPALGFVGRRGIREYWGRFRYRWRPSGWLRRVDTGFFTKLTTDLDNKIESFEVWGSLIELQNHAGDGLELDLNFSHERLDDVFEISDGTVIPIGEYDWASIDAEIGTSEHRVLSVRLKGGYGGFYAGNRLEHGVEFSWKPSPSFSLTLEDSMNHISLPEGSFMTHLLLARAEINFSPDVSWNTTMQYDNLSRQMGVNSRFRWIIEPGNEIFIVLNQGFGIRDWRFRAEGTELAAKIAWTLRF